ncbi:ATP-binding protein [uncultured Halomonas sp.]|uniref:ATP-binding protein n=1 Tax=uncultured Halomonas sp. TaxID=173971 RepID=UPI00260F28D2|nr:ATP-binding protein [uncultured Halomonas sp.]
MRVSSCFKALVFRCISCILVALTTLSWLVGAQAASEPIGDHDEKAAVIDLNVISPTDNLALDMLGFDVVEEGHLSLSEAMHSGRWQQVGENVRILERPRQYSTLWLQARLTNTSDEHLVRWLSLTPWRLNEVNAWLVDPESFETIKEMATGLSVPIGNREVDSNKATIPVALSPGESLLLVMRVFSDSRPFLDINGWEPVAFAMSEMAERQFHSMLLAAVLTLFAVLLVTFDLRYLLLGVWLVVIFIFESEKEGYISQVLIRGLFDYSANLRFSTWILTEALFLVASVYILGVNKVKPWRYLTPVVFMVSAAFAVLTFLLNGVVIRHMGNAIDLSFSLAWLAMIPAALRVDRKWQLALLGTLSLWWIASNFILIGYITNLYYTASFAELKIFAGSAIVLSLILIYARQKRDYEMVLERRLRESERDQREKLEGVVARRTHDLNLALDNAIRADEEKTLFIGHVSHDLKSPLTAISGYAQLLFDEDDKVAAKGRIIHSSAAHMDKLVERLIDYARGVASHKERLSHIHVESFFSAISQEAMVLARKNSNRFSMTVKADGFPFVRCDDVSLRQVVVNLIDNAAKYTSSGHISLEVVCREAMSPTGRTMLEMTLKDSGIGISREAQSRLFEPFSRESRHGKGSGLGLAIVKDLVASMAGELALHSELGKGTEVNVLIPVEIGDEGSQSSAAVSMPKALLPAYHAGGLTAWVVEDSPPILELLCGDLSAMGFHVKGFQSGEEAIAAMQSADAMPALIVTDYRVQSVLGDEVLMAAKDRNALVPVVLISAMWSVLRSRERQGELKGEQEGGGYEYDALLYKPIDLINFRREVARVCVLEPLQQPPMKEAAIDKESPPDIERLKELVKLGAVSDILDWCDVFSVTFPNKKGLARSLRRHAERGEFSAISEAIEHLD